MRRAGVLVGVTLLLQLAGPVFAADVVIPVDRADDLHGLDVLETADLRVFMAGNQFFVMPELLRAFQARHPEVRKVFYATLPPGLLLKWILAGTAVFQGRPLRGDADVFASVTADHMRILETRGYVTRFFPYAGNRLVIAVARGNPKRIATVNDLGRPDVRLSQTNPLTEGITVPTIEMYRRAGGDELVWQIMSIKAAAQTTTFTSVHHRETPTRLIKGEVDAGNVWITEYLEYERKGWPIEKIEPGPALDMRDAVKYVIARVDKVAKNGANADNFLAFIKSPAAQAIYAKHGFVPAFPTE
jgi:ABC-type molybdate transport system substrate-binding protein